MRSPFLFGELSSSTVQQEIKLRESAGLMALVEGTVTSTRQGQKRAASKQQSQGPPLKKAALATPGRPQSQPPQAKTPAPQATQVPLMPKALNQAASGKKGGKGKKRPHKGN